MFSGSRLWRIASGTLEITRPPLLMGILNVTPDSFSDGGEFLESRAAIEHGLALVEDGADLLDIGGESTRPGSDPVPEDEQIRRVEPVIRELAPRIGVPISIDTTSARVAARALEAGAAIVNDISGLTFDPEMIPVCRDAGAGVVCMHIQGTPRTMQLNPHYDDVVRDVRDFLAARLEHLEAHGIPRERVVIDPGIGFGKTAGHNLELLSHVREFKELGRPVLYGHSRKRFLAKLVGRPVDERTGGTIGVSIALAMQQADILRVHDVRATRDALVAWDAIASRAG